MRKQSSLDETMVLALTVDRLGDPGVVEVAKDLGLPKPPAGLGQRLVGMLHDDWRRFVPEREAPRVQVGTVRREAPKVQRNDPCPCGSGRKFKKCCADKGVFAAPVVVEQSRDIDDYWAMRPAEIARLDPSQLGRLELVTCMRVASRFHQWELAERLMTALDDHLQDPEEVDGFREELCQEATAAGAADVVDRIIAGAHDPDELAERVGLGVGLLRPDAGTLARLEAKAAAGLRGDADALYELAYGLLDHSPALGILVARGALDPERSIDSWQLVEDIERARDVLLMPPGDPAAVAYERMMSEHADAETQRVESDAVGELTRSIHEKQHTLEAAQREAATLQHKMEEANKRIARLEKAASAKTAAAASAPALDHAAAAAHLQGELVCLRGRVTELEGLVTENASRRRALERQLEERSSTAGPRVVSDAGGEARAEAGDRDAEVEVDDEPLAPRTVSVPSFDEAAAHSLRRLDRATASRVVRAVGLVAAADPGAWRDVKALRVAPGHLRLRVGQYRVLFRVDAERRVLVVERIVPRNELAATVRRVD